MIYGIIAAADEAAMENYLSFQLPQGQFDFVNGVYSWGNISLTAAEVVDQTGWIGVNGLAVPGSSSAAAAILYSGITNLLASCDFTVVFEIETLNTNTADILTVYDDTDTYMVQVLADGGEVSGYYEIADYGGSSRYLDDTVNGLPLGIHKIAATTTTDRISLSIDGNEVLTNAAASTVPVIGSPMTKFYLGGVFNHTYAAVRIRSMSFYETQFDSRLPILSA